jgi:type I restriction enzyme, S subunit
MTQLRSFTLAVPPLAEQKRIVAKVDQLMALCDELETKLTQSQTDGDALAASLVHHLCTPNTDNLKEAAS